MRRVALCATLLSLAAVLPAAGQSIDARDPSTARVRLAPELSFTRLAGSWVTQAGGSVSLDLSPWLSVGGTGRVGVEHPTVDEGSGRVRVRFGYGGVRLAARDPSRPSLSWEILAGAGNVDVEEPSVGGTVDSDNGAILEPAVGWRHPLGPSTALTGAVSWRLAFGFDALGNVDSSLLHGPSLTFGFSFGPF